MKAATSWSNHAPQTSIYRLRCAIVQAQTMQQMVPTKLEPICQLNITGKKRACLPGAKKTMRRVIGKWC